MQRQLSLDRHVRLHRGLSICPLTLARRCVACRWTMHEPMPRYRRVTGRYPITHQRPNPLNVRSELVTAAMQTRLQTARNTRLRSRGIRLMHTLFLTTGVLTLGHLEYVHARPEIGGDDTKETAVVHIRCGFRHDPIQWARTSPSLQAALVRTLVLQEPAPDKGGRIEEEIGRVLGDQHDDGRFMRPCDDGDSDDSTADSLYYLLRLGVADGDSTTLLRVKTDDATCETINLEATKWNVEWVNNLVWVDQNAYVYDAWWPWLWKVEADGTCHPHAGFLCGNGSAALTAKDNTIWMYDSWANALMHAHLNGDLIDCHDNPFHGEVSGLAWDGSNLWALDGDSHRVCLIERVAQDGPEPDAAGVGR